MNYSVFNITHYLIVRMLVLDIFSIRDCLNIHFQVYFKDENAVCKLHSESRIFQLRDKIIVKQSDFRHQF